MDGGLQREGFHVRFLVPAVIADFSLDGKCLTISGLSVMVSDAFVFGFEIIFFLKLRGGDSVEVLGPFLFIRTISLIGFRLKYF